MICFDLEWNRAYSNEADAKVFYEILQIGAVYFDAETGKIIDTFSAIVHPTFSKRFKAVTKQLPIFEDCFRSKLNFKEAFRNFSCWCDGWGENQFAVWGAEDCGVLFENCKRWEEPKPKFQRIYDVQYLFRRKARMMPIPSLSRAVEYLGILEKDGPTFHDASSDAYYTARIYRAIRSHQVRMLDPKDSDYLLPSSYVFCKISLEEPMTLETEWCKNRRFVFRKSKIQDMKCPLCNSKLKVGTWFKREKNRYIGTARCANHGDFLCHLQLAQNEDKCFRGTLKLTVPTSDEVKRFKRIACKNGGS